MDGERTRNVDGTDTKIKRITYCADERVEGRVPLHLVLNKEAVKTQRQTRHISRRIRAHSLSFGDDHKIPSYIKSDNLFIS